MRHHFVPQFLLRAWTAAANDKMLQEFRLDLDGVPARRRAPKSTGYQPDLYALTRTEVASMRKQAIETQFLRVVDNEAARVREKLIQQGLSKLSKTDRCDWVRFLMSLRLRQPEIVSKLKIDAAEHLRISLAVRPEEYEGAVNDDDLPTLEQWGEDRYPGLVENFGLSFFHELVDNKEIGDKLLALHWWLWDFSEAKHDLLLADHPCIYTGALDEAELIVALPISPTRAFLATRGNQSASMLREIDVTELALRLNESSVLQARARIYARTVGPRRFIQNRIRRTIV